MTRDITLTRWRSILALAFVFCLAVAGFARADGGGGGGGGGGGQDSTGCPDGQVYDKRTGFCAKRTAGMMPDEDLAEQAYRLAKAERYQEALDILNILKNPNTAVALNYRGYVTRHLGRLDEGIGYYLRSVKLDPKYAQVREYLGEAYVIKGDLKKAKAQLARIKAICGNTECEEYEDLEKAISGKGTES